MHLPHIDPNVVLWFSVVANVVATVASSLAAWAAMKLYLRKLRAEAAALLKKV